VSSRPILVTGSHRSGTTWTGALLGLSGEALPIHEPFNPTYPRSWLRQPPTRWFQHLDASANANWSSQISDIVGLRPPLASMLRRSAHPRHVTRVLEEAAQARLARRRSARALLKDPIAFFSAPWLAQHADAQVVVLVRHPAAFASSLKRLGWAFDFSNLSEQPALMDGPLAGFRTEIDEALAHGLDIIDTATLLWRMINTVALRYGEEHSDWEILRYEDLAADPIGGFQDLYARLGLAWSESVAHSVALHTGEGKGRAVADGDKGGIVRDSNAAMWTWTDRLTSDEIGRVRSQTASVAMHFYSDDDWNAPRA
jgi:hypothetical protein